MPSDLNTSATFGELLLQLAVRTGFADYSGSVAALPTDAHRLAKLKSYVNDGYDRFLRANPKWTFLVRMVPLTFNTDGTGPSNIDGEPARYRLPGYVSGPPLGDWTYVDERTSRRAIGRVHPDIIDGYRQVNGETFTGVPIICGHRPFSPKDPIGNTQTAWEAIFWPAPDSTYAVQAPFRVAKHRMVELGERHIAGADHDASIAAYAVWVWKEDDAEDPAELAKYRLEAVGDPGGGVRGRLQESIDLDEQNFPDSVGYSAPPDTSAYRRGSIGSDERILPRVASHNGVAIPYN